MLRRVGSPENCSPVATATAHMRTVREIMGHDRISAWFAAGRVSTDTAPMSKIMLDVRAAA